MSNTTVNTGDVAVIVDFPQRGDLPAEEQIARSQRAIEQAMGTIRLMVDRFQASIAGIYAPPQSVEVEFGVTFDAEAGAVLARSGEDRSISVRLAWSRPS